jgi:hypothetical protein
MQKTAPFLWFSTEAETAAMTIVVSESDNQGGSMRPMIRSILAVVTGFVVASALMMAVEAVNGRYLYPELGKLANGVTDREVLRIILAGAPVGALLVVILGWVLGSLAGGGVAAWIGKRAPVGHALVLGGLLTLGGIANNLIVPPPFWFWVAGIMVLIPAAYAGARLAPQPSIQEDRRSKGK